MSILLEAEPKQIPLLSLVGALATLDAIQAITGLEGSIKWPNDVLLKSRKVAGLLVETISRPGKSPPALLGLGLNLSQQTSDFPEELQNSAISLKQAGGRSIPRVQALAAFLDSLANRMTQSPIEIVADVRSCLAHLGRATAVRTAGEPLAGTAEKLDDAGHLHLRLASGEVRILASGESDFPA